MMTGAAYLAPTVTDRRAGDDVDDNDDDCPAGGEHSQLVGGDGSAEASSDISLDQSRQALPRHRRCRSHFLTRTPKMREGWRPAKRSPLTQVSHARTPPKSVGCLRGWDGGKVWQERRS